MEPTEKVTLAILGTLALALIALLWLRGRKTDAAAKWQAAIVAKDLRELIDQALPWLCTQAEKLLGSGTGAIKRSYVVQEAMKLLPEAVRAQLDTDRLGGAIDAALAKLRPLWEEKPGLIAPEGILVEGEEDDTTYLVAAKDIAAGERVTFRAAIAPVDEYVPPNTAEDTTEDGDE
jgi:hypothetical protein